MFRRRLDLWLPTYLATAHRRFRWQRQHRAVTTHILFLICDHFEPLHEISTPHQAHERLQQWREGFSELRRRCQHAFGHAPMHTWFYLPHHGAAHLSALAEFQFLGLGEVELHYHHEGDTAASLQRNLQAAVTEYQRWGLLLESGEYLRTAFGFIHGDWALNNSCHGKYCGVNDELTILRDLGCWGDFTMPSANECQTRKINSIYYSPHTPNRPKSHNWGRDAAVGRHNPHGLLLMQGPLGINWRAPNYPRVENASLTSDNWGRPDRIKKWLDCHVHVRGRPEWVFIKLHAHGAMERDFDALFGDKAFKMHDVLNRHYNDGTRYRLHYVTAREAYNIAKAAEFGLTGNPSAYRDFQIAPPAARYYHADSPHRLNYCTSTRVQLEEIPANRKTEVRFRNLGLSAIVGRLSQVDVDANPGTVRLTCRDAGERIQLYFGSDIAIDNIRGARFTGQRVIADGLPVDMMSEHKEVSVQYLT
ncbi:MAG: hypothetical protein HY273_11125 [Gammaproteobacteria bacterium]|nr:hypothetical protein [Gammaproteobacteria bacterium]